MIWRKSIRSVRFRWAPKGYRSAQGSGEGRERDGRRGEHRSGAGAERAARGGALRAARGVPRAGAVSDPAVYEEAAADPEAWWLRQANELLDWDEAPSEGPRRLQPALLQVVRRRQDQRLGQLPRSPCRGRDRRSRRLPLARRGGRGARRHLRRAARRHAALRQRAEGPRRRQGRRGRDLPADDPRGRRRDAGLRADRRHAQRRLRRLLGRGGARADGVLRGEGAGHGRRRPPQGQDGADQAAGRRAHGRPGDAGDDRRRPPHRYRLPDAARGATASTTS